MKNNLLKKMFFVAIMLTSSVIFAQTVSGTVSDNNGPLPGASVVVKGTTNGGDTDFDGKFSLDNVAADAVLVVSFLGYETQEIAVAGRSQIDVVLIAGSESLEEVTVTALGITRERKSLGYSVQEVKGDVLAERSETNVTNALSGQVAGLQVMRSSNGPAGSSKIIIRGNNSLTGDNQPLIVIDGVPVDNSGGANADFWNPTQDTGNGLGDINSNDIETISVLKGASAAALYGSRGGNGVILITTKTGRQSDGLGITYSATLGTTNTFMAPDMQNVFGQGSEGIFDPVSGSSWGPKAEGQTVTDWEGKQVPLNIHDNIDNFYEGGFTQDHSLSFQNRISNGTSLYTSANYLNDQSNIPGSTLERLNLTSRAVSVFGKTDNWTVDTKIQYINTIANNRPINGQNDRNSFGTIATLPRSLDIREFKDHTDEFGNMIWWSEGNGSNPYWAANNALSNDKRNRFILTGMLKNQINDWLSAEVRGGADIHNTVLDSKLYAGGRNSVTGRYSTGYRNFQENNFSAMVTASKNNLFGKFGGTALLGGNLMKQFRTSLSSSSGELVVPNLFSLNNGVNPPTVSQGRVERKMNSIYGTLQVNYDDFLYLDVTGRNDWTSTLSEDNRSFFYPSVSASFVLTELLDKNDGNPDWLNFAKFRGSYATVGNDMDPYQLYNFYSIGKDPNGNTTASSNSTKFNENIKSELIKSTEIGFETRMFNNRLYLDFAWYKTNATNQILRIPVDPLSGFTGSIVNAGDIQNTGFEITANGSIFDNPEGFSWDVNVNYSHNKNTIEELTDDVTQYGLGGFDNMSILAVSGGRYGEIHGTKFQRVEDEADPNFGAIIVDANGIPLGTSERFHVGDQEADALLGMTNSFSYKNFALSVLVDARIGGEIFSGTNRAIQQSGTGAATVVNGERADIVFDGVMDDGSGSYTQNTTGVSPQLYWGTLAARTGNLGITEHNIYDATNVRLRNIQLDYTFPSEWLGDSGIQRAKVGFSANNVWMISSNLNGVDPESVFATNSNATGFENLTSPTQRSFFFNVTLSF
ncbi:SusC/RagA family TonB-linked outer membrane protein [Urechidicola vernalis]|uniref:SusC/RagA family TonB-linked outer membrane protein n=1 Tax=Urechidicola vernalis TaxID=3075600 RepID=A0ABU2Y6A3_9FLAO|nr:SusC/RagA family TonB-linked outer membrane protein [Urechidicola sp. P050]MDT0553572.1 SusC/RagA family TonB-linked outer membrane protein [Urechidicola sp. P050]